MRPPLQAGLVFVPLALAFVVASRHSAVRARHRGTLVLLEGCVIQIAGLAALVLMIFGYGQGLVMAPLSGVVLSTVKPASAGSGAGMYGTTSRIANAAGVAAIGAAFFAVEAAHSARLALLVASALFVVSILICAVFLSWITSHGANPG